MAGGTVSSRLLVFDDELLRRGQSGAIWGRIYFDIDGEPFPDRGWSDLVVPIADAWLEALLKMTSGTMARAKVHFMDGPFYVTIALAAPGIASLSFVHRGVIKRSLTSSLDVLLQDAIASGEQLLRICGEHDWSDDSDCSHLAANLQRAIKSLPA
ncbi:MAG TPA: hypothetical protein VMF66_02780 [Candidatus Acidoferrum sp.]|jgi:hypothetical protein|nr:hypothetical protein [Candidatus Acidoferrum sp.]